MRFSSNHQNGGRAEFTGNEENRMTTITKFKPRPLIEEPVRVYVAGAVLEASADRESSFGEILFWRAEIFQIPNALEYCNLDDAVIGRFHYAGPTIEAEHGLGNQKLAGNCLAQVARADVLFAWIDRTDTIGTVAEIGAAYALRKPIFVAFANRQLSQHFYFAKQLATMATIMPTAVKAWEVFVKRQDVQDLAV
jgi:nucleoside 2-deoxyribosyltransferase